MSPSFEVAAPHYELAFSADGRFAYATERDYTPYNESRPRTIVIDTITLQVTIVPIVDWFHPELIAAGFVLEP